MSPIQVFTIALLCVMPALAWAEDGSDNQLNAVSAVANDDQGVEPWSPLENQDEAASRLKGPASLAGKDGNTGCHRQQRAQTVFYTQ